MSGIRNHIKRQVGNSLEAIPYLDINDENGRVLDEVLDMVLTDPLQAVRRGLAESGALRAPAT